MCVESKREPQTRETLRPPSARGTRRSRCEVPQHRIPLRIDNCTNSSCL